MQWLALYLTALRHQVMIVYPSVVRYFDKKFLINSWGTN